MKTCTKCKRELPVDQCRDNRRACKGCAAKDFKEYYASHKTETAEYNKKYRTEHKEERALYEVGRRYNITPGQYRVMTANGCEVCGSKENLHIDHDHRCCTGRYTCGQCLRGVLCRNHNVALGILHDSVDELMALVAYLLQFENVLEMV